MPAPPPKEHQFKKNNAGRPKGTKNKSTQNAKEAIARFVDGNTERLQEWLDEIYESDGPHAAFKCFSDLIEYHVPKLSRSEVTGKDEGPVELVVSWGKSK